MANARVLVERFEQEKNAGLKASRDGAPSQARVHFLKAAECLYKLANSSSGTLRESRYNMRGLLRSPELRVEKRWSRARRGKHNQHTGSKHVNHRSRSHASLQGIS